MASVIPLASLTSQQSQVESSWYQVVQILANMSDINFQTIIIPNDRIDALGHNGLTALAQRCSAFTNTNVEVKEDLQTATVRLHIMSEYNSPKKDVSESSSDDEIDIDVGDITQDKSAKVTRPANSFILYRKFHHPTIVAQNPGLHNNEISKIIGKMWNEESEAVKTGWKAKSAKVKQQHLRDHPGYHYKPRKAADKKRRMTKKKAEAAAKAAKSSPFTPEQVIELGNMQTPALNYSTNGQLATFVFDSSQQHQMDVFEQMLNDHNALIERTLVTATPTAANPAATVLPTVAQVGDVTLHTPESVVEQALTESQYFRDSLENMLAHEIEGLLTNDPRDVNDTMDAQTYNNLESKRFADMLSQTPQHMWGMDFVQPF